jgi:hypothetical protein
MSDELVGEHVVERVVKVNGTMGSGRYDGEHDGGDGNLTAKGRRERSGEGGEDSGGGETTGRRGRGYTSRHSTRLGKGRRGSQQDGRGVTRQIRNVEVCDHKRCRGYRRWWDRRQ